jgi:hypothetical protein
MIMGRVELSRNNLRPRINTMTNDKIALRGLMEKGCDATFLPDDRFCSRAADAAGKQGHLQRSPWRAQRQIGAISAMAIAIATGKPGPER